MPKVFKLQQLGNAIQQILNAVAGKAEQSDLNAHTGNGDVHVSTTDKNRWNDTYTKTQVDERIEQGGKVKTVSVNGGSAVQPDAHGNIDIEVPTDLKDLNGDSTHRTVTDEEKGAWNGKQPAGDYATNAGVNGKIGDMQNLDTTAKSTLVGAINELKQGLDGKVDIVSIEQTVVATESEGNNEVSVTLSDGTVVKFYIKNGAKGDKGVQGDTLVVDGQNTYKLYHELGQNNDGAVDQRVVTNLFVDVQSADVAEDSDAKAIQLINGKYAESHSDGVKVRGLRTLTEVLEDYVVHEEEVELDYPSSLNDMTPGYQVDASTKKWKSQGPRYIVCYPYTYRKDDALVLTANANQPTYYLFLKSDPRPISVGKAVDYALDMLPENYNWDWRSIGAGTTATIPIPSDCGCIVINHGWIQGSNPSVMAPTSIKIKSFVPNMDEGLKDDVEELQEQMAIMNTGDMPVGEVLSNCEHETQGDLEEECDLSSVTLVNKAQTWSDVNRRLIFSQGSLIPFENISTINCTIASDAITNSHITKVALEFFDSAKTVIMDCERYLTTYTVGQALEQSVDITGADFKDAKFFSLYFLTEQSDNTQLYASDVNLNKIEITLVHAAKIYTKAVDEVMFNNLVSQLGLRSTGSYDGEKISINHKFDIEVFCNMTTSNTSSQGAAIWGNYLFHFCDHLATIFVYDVTTKTVVKTFSLTGVDSNHANSGDFGLFYDDTDPFPLLYIGGQNDRFVRVYRITGSSVNDWSIALHQTITLPASSSDFMYLPCVAIDRENGKMVVYGYKDSASNPTGCIVGYLPIPSMSGDVEIVVNLDVENYRNDFEKLSVLPYITSLQGATAKYGTLYMAYGNSNNSYKDGGFVVIDYVNGIIRSKCNFFGLITLEPEAFCFYGEGALIPTQFPNWGGEGKMYYIKF